jgi:D-alanine-D-alanine ligase
MRIALLYGGRSGEHEISIRSAKSIYSELKKTHQVYPIFIDKDGRWWRVDAQEQLPATHEKLKDRIYAMPGFDEPTLYTGAAQLKIDIVFPVLHGTHGEDGIVQGLLESAGIPYVGANVAASAAGMDKVIMKALFAQSSLPVADYTWLSRNQWRNQSQACIQKIENAFPYPVFVKPANLGSSVGINKAQNRNELIAALDDAAKYDSRLIVERGLKVREIECSVLGNDEPRASAPGEIVPKREFYDYVAKYIEDSTELHVPARLDPAQVAEAQSLAIKAFQAIGCSGMGRVDLFLEKETGRFYVNEINTIPGFTNISMYPKLWEASGLSFGALLDELLRLGLDRFREQAQNVTSYQP